MTSDLVFVDTNILLYAHDRSAGLKHEIARDFVAQRWGSRTGVLSTQVLQEFYVNVTRKLPRPMTAARARAVIARYATWSVRRIEPADIIAASELEKQHRLSFWDALVIISAMRAGASILATEDLQHGRGFAGGLTVVNPFDIDRSG
jgi:predicted nucleic acid-binding protein